MILYIGNKLSRHGYTPTSIDTLGEKLKEQFDVLTVSEKKNKILRFLDIIWTIIINRKKTKLILIDTYSSSNFYFAIVAGYLARIFKIPYIPILHGGNLLERLTGNPKLSAGLFLYSYINVSPSTYLYNAFTSHGYKVEYIPNSIDINMYPVKERNNIKPYFLYVRSFHKIYNPEMAIKVLKEISSQFNDYKLCMVGPDKDGSLERVKKLAEGLGVSDKVIFTGQLSKKEWISLSADYDIFINTTNFDNHPVSVVEAMALGFPVVSTNVGGLPFLIENGNDGLLVPPQDENAFTIALLSILKNPDKARELAINARKKAETFKWENVSLKWNELLHSAQLHKNDLVK